LNEAIRNKLLGLERNRLRGGVTWKPLPPDVVHKLMADPKVQARHLRFYSRYVAIVIASELDHKPLHGTFFAMIRPQMDEELVEQGPETVPALVSEINRVVRWRMGFC
jgi:hypothetical protein